MITWVLAAALAQAADRCGAADAAGPLPPDCSHWRSVYRSDRGEVFVDPASLQRNGETFELTYRVVFTRVIDGVRTTIARSSYDCTRRTAAFRHLAVFDDAGAELGVVAMSGPQAEPEVPAADASDGVILTEYCPRPGATS